MRELLEELRAEVRRTSPITAESLRPGLPVEVLQRELATLPFAISGDAVGLYSWADGSTGSRFEVLPGAYFYPFDAAMSDFRSVFPSKQKLQGIFFQSYFDQFRFLGDRSDGGYGFGGLKSPSEGKIVHLCIHEDWKIAYPNLEALLKTSIECYRRGLVKPDTEIADFRAYYELAGQMNSGMEAWR